MVLIYVTEYTVYLIIWKKFPFILGICSYNWFASAQWESWILCLQPRPWLFDRSVQSVTLIEGFAFLTIYECSNKKMVALQMNIHKVSFLIQIEFKINSHTLTIQVSSRRTNQTWTPNKESSVCTFALRAHWVILGEPG